jgi:hypothetical protein
MVNLTEDQGKPTDFWTHVYLTADRVECSSASLGGLVVSLSSTTGVVGLLDQRLHWLAGMLLVSRYRLVEEDAVEVFHYYGFHFSSSFLMYNFKLFQGK